MKVILDTNIDTSHLKDVFIMLKELELKEGTLSQFQVVYPKEQINYNIWHNKKSFTITSQRVNI